MNSTAVQRALTLSLTYELNSVALKIDNSWFTAWNMPQRMVSELILRKIQHCTFYWHTQKIKGNAVAQWLRCCVTNRKVAGSIPAGIIRIFHWHKILSIALWTWGRLSLLQKWVPGAFPGGKGGWCIWLTTLPPSCAVVMKSGNLNILETSGPLQACNGSALPFYSENETPCTSFLKCVRFAGFFRWIYNRLTYLNRVYPNSLQLYIRYMGKFHAT